MIGYSHHCEITLIKHFLDEVGREGNRIGIQFGQGIPHTASLLLLGQHYLANGANLRDIVYVVGRVHLSVVAQPLHQIATCLEVEPENFALGVNRQSHDLTCCGMKIKFHPCK